MSPRKSSSQHSAKRRTARHRGQPQRSDAPTWLGTGALALGFGAAALTGGTGTAQAHSDPPAHPAVSKPSTTHQTPGGRTHRGGPEKSAPAARTTAATPTQHDPRPRNERHPKAVAAAATPKDAPLAPAHHPASPLRVVAAVITPPAPNPTSNPTPAPATATTPALATAAVPAAGYAGPAPSTTPPDSGPLVNLLGGVLSFFGLNTVQPPANPVWALVWVGFREIESALGLVPRAGDPTVRTPAISTGQVTGKLNAVAPLNLPLTYTIIAAPTQGTVTVDSAGRFSYTPTTTARYAATNATTDTFTVAISNQLAGVAERVTVPISPLADTPTAPITGPQTVTNGVVTGTLASTDPGGKPLTYTAVTASGPTNGTVAVDANGTYTYTPTTGAQQSASVGGATTDTFQVTATNGTYTSTAGSISVPITPIPDTPSAPQSGVQSTDANGVVTGSLSATDPVGKPLTYNAVATGGPSGGTVEVASDGTFTYTPTLAARELANAGGPTTDTFQVTATNGTYTSAPGTITVPISPLPAGTIVATISAGLLAPYAVAVSPSGNTVYVTNSGNSTVSVIDAATNTIVATVPVSNAPLAVAITPDGSTAYVAAEPSNVVSVIDTATNTVTATIPVGTQPYGVAVSPNGTTAYVTNGVSNTVSVINTATNQVTTTIPVGGTPYGVAFSPNGSYAYVTNSGDGSVSVIDTATNTVTASIAVGAIYPWSVAVTPDSGTAYVANSASNNVSVIDTATNTVTTTIPVGATPQSVAVSADGKTAYVANVFGNSLSVIDTATNTVTATFGLDGHYANTVALSPDGTMAYVAGAISGTVTVVYLGG